MDTEGPPIRRLKQPMRLIDETRGGIYLRNELRPATFGCIFAPSQPITCSKAVSVVSSSMVELCSADRFGRDLLVNHFGERLSYPVVKFCGDEL